MCVLCAAAASIPLVLGIPSSSAMLQHSQAFTVPVDAVSAHVEPSDAVTFVRAQRDDGSWSEWKNMTVDDEQDPRSTETNAVVFERPESMVEMKTNAKRIELHPIRVSHAPISTIQAARVPVNTSGTHRIVTREEWGADPDLLVSSGGGGSSSSNPAAEISDNGPATPSVREQECNDHVRLYPDEFKVANTVTTDAQGRRLRWAQQQMREVKMLVVHHTAMSVVSDGRPSVERMRALYQYHAQNRGWGDIGYHYIIDEKGVIYEGRAGGPHVVGGHAYCNNVGTLGIALMGNFEESAPPQEQVAALQWLLKTLADREHVDLNRSTSFHGETYPAIVGHRDVLSTTCPGFYLYGVLSQIREHVRLNTVDEPVNFPVKPQPKSAPYVDRTAERRAKREQGLGSSGNAKVGLSTIGATTITGRPGEQMLMSVRYQAGANPLAEGVTLAKISRSSGQIGLWIDRNGSFQRLRDELPAPARIPAGGNLAMRLRLQFPTDTGTTTLSIGPVSYTLVAEGRRVRDRTEPPSLQSYIRDDEAPSPETTVTSSSASSARSSAASSVASLATSGNIRIRLTLDRARRTSLTTVMMRASDEAIVGSSTLRGPIWLKLGDTACTLEAQGVSLSQGILRIDTKGGYLSYTDGVGERHFRGIMECRVIDGVMTVINELPLEWYMEGVSEEPDTEPAEKQKAFAVAARSYAAFYMDPQNRKYPGKPYDGSDDAANFQKYSGEPVTDIFGSWIDGVRATSGMVLTKNGSVLKLPYFTSDDGRTRSPKEAGWPNFPFAEVFASKPDPWCNGERMWGHGVGMSGCGARGQANEGKTWQEILQYYYPGTTLTKLR